MTSVVEEEIADVLKVHCWKVKVAVEDDLRMVKPTFVVKMVVAVVHE